MVCDRDTHFFSLTSYLTHPQNFILYHKLAGEDGGIRVCTKISPFRKNAQDAPRHI